MRGEGLETRRARLGDLIERAAHDRFDLSPTVTFDSWRAWKSSASTRPIRSSRRDDQAPRELLSGRRASRANGSSGSATLLIDAVMMYAQRGHGKRSSYYSDFTFGVWTGGAGEEVLVPVGKAISASRRGTGNLDKFVRNNTTDRFGPVRAVRADRDMGFVLEVAFEGIALSNRHKSGRGHALSADRAAENGQATDRGGSVGDADGLMGER